jgi:hypothetical protein
MVRRWGKIWYYIGIAGTVILIILWTVTRAPDPITEGRALPINEIGVTIEVFQIAYIVITAIIIVKEKSGRPSLIKEKRALICWITSKIWYDRFGKAPLLFTVRDR